MNELLKDSSFNTPDVGDEDRPKYLNIAQRLERYFADLKENDIERYDMIFSDIAKPESLPDHIENNFTVRIWENYIYHLMNAWEEQNGLN